MGPIAEKEGYRDRRRGERGCEARVRAVEPTRAHIRGVETRRRGEFIFVFVWAISMTSCFVSGLQIRFVAAHGRDVRSRRGRARAAGSVRRSVRRVQRARARVRALRGRELALERVVARRVSRGVGKDHRAIRVPMDRGSKRERKCRARRRGDETRGAASQ